MENRAKNIEHLHFIIDRYDHYYDTVNNKGQFYLAINTFLLGVLGAAYVLLQSKSLLDGQLTALICVLAGINWVSIFFTLLAILPYLGKGKGAKQPSITFYGSVASLKFKGFQQRLNAADDAVLEEDLSRQAHQLAKGLDSKFWLLTRAGYMLAVQFFLLLPFSIILLNKI